MRLMTVRLAIFGLWLAGMIVPAAATAPCGGDFDAWLEGLKTEAAAQGVSQRTIQAAWRRHLRPERHRARPCAGRVPAKLRAIFRPHGAAAARQGPKLLKQYAPIFARIEQQFGVPGPVIIAIWGLETDFGANSGKFPTIRALATLAYDCRRPDKFRPEVIAALQIVDRGDMTPADMHGAWAGEIGQTQFLPSSYLKYAVDFDGSGHRDLIRNVPDVLASTANYLKGYGWQRGQPWGEGTANFDVLLQWNASKVYTKTVAAFRRTARRHPVASGARGEGCGPRCLLSISSGGFAVADPALEKHREPGAGAVVINFAIREMLCARLGARHCHAHVPARGPAVHHRVRHVGMELQRVAAAGAERLHLEHVAFGQQLGAARLLEAFAVPLIDLLRPVADQRETGRVGRIG